MQWVFLMLAIGFEVGGLTCMKLSEGFSKLVPSVLVFVLYGACLGMLTLAVEKLPVAVVYAVWSAVGTVAIVVVGRMAFDEQMSRIQLASIALIIVGVVGLNLTRTHEDAAPARPASEPAVADVAAQSS